MVKCKISAENAKTNFIFASLAKSNAVVSSRHFDPEWTIHIANSKPGQILNVVLHDHSESGEETGEYNSKAVRASHVQSHLSTALVVTGASFLGSGGSCCSSISSESIVNNLPSCTGCSTSGGSCRRCCDSGEVDFSRVLGTARMILSASTLARSVSVACCHALIAVFCAFEVWEGLGVFGQIGC